jgi:MATE family multidrug resistance protein
MAKNSNSENIATQNESSAGSAPLVEGSLWRAIWIMSWPLLITTVANSLVGLTDLYVAGHLGSIAQAAVGLSEQIIFMFLLFIMATGTGTTALVSRYWGKGDRETAFDYTAQSLVMAIVLGILLAISSYFSAHHVLGAFTESREVTRLCTVYLGIFSLYMIPFSVVCISNAAFRAIGDAKTPLFVVSTFTVLSIVGDFLLVLNNWPIANLGVRGIAISALTSSSIAALLALYKLSRSELAPSLKRLNRVLPDMLKKIVKIGIPSAIQRMAWATSTFVLFFILARCPLPTEALASWSIGMRVEGLMFMPVMALSMAVSSIVGQNLGAREIERAYKAGWQVAWIGIGMLTVMAAVLFLSAVPIAHCFSKDSQTIEYVISYLRVNSLSEPFLALGMILGGAFQGAGETRTPMWITFLSNWVIRLPLAYYLALHLGHGPTGAWWAMTLSVVIMGLVTAWRFKARTWTQLHV